LSVNELGSLAHADNVPTSQNLAAKSLTCAILCKK